MFWVKGSLRSWLFYSQRPQHQLLMPIMGEKKTLVFEFFSDHCFPNNACPPPSSSLSLLYSSSLGVLGSFMAPQSHISHLTLFSVLMCEMRELNYMITKFLSGSDILSFVCINTDSYIKDSGSENFLCIHPTKFHWCLKHSLLSIRLKIILTTYRLKRYYPD